MTDFKIENTLLIKEQRLGKCLFQKIDRVEE